jgi:hypothetical protein
MFEEYLQDSYEFLSSAEGLASRGATRESRRYFRAAIFYASGAIEAFVNYLADSFAKAKSLPEHEVLFLTDKALVFARNKGFTEKTEFHPLESKLRVLIGKFVPGFDFKGLIWNRFVEFKDLRDSLVHPRESDDYKSKVRAGLKAIIELMNEIMKGMSGRPLRKQILDLIPE